MDSGNGAKIKFWEDSILGQPPLFGSEGLENIKNWLHSFSKYSLWDISRWGPDDRWIEWDLGPVPPPLVLEARALLFALQGLSPISSKLKDKRGWGSSFGKYSAAAGYFALKAIPWAAPNPSVWRNLWLHPSLPKIDLFCWTLLHNSILTWDNLLKRGWEGPSICPLCVSHEESSIHLFLQCPFALEIWTIIIDQLNLILPSSILLLFAHWTDLAPFPLARLKLIKNCWMWIPKILCWKVWLERNNRVFRDKAGT